ncbi:SocA family protein [Pikeienuella piscinae]|uniref:SocA family protein n=1 Tax=Pikeienuella piscinae TaxID=2748098 RepID=A0A7M3T6C3_9RHOB|nr:Panacea domain-containing protein [Pikeienuella piscinae]QIE57554.1 SocA family protein [Pikeienuella piscinae]
MSYDPRKAAQTIAYLAIRNGRRPLNIVKAVKLVYLADRESVMKSGFPIQDEPRVSMKHGPVNSKTYSFINGEYDPEMCGWSEFLSDRSGHRIGLADEKLDIDDLDELSDADIQVLDEVWNKFGQMDQWALVDWTHQPNNVPEWENPGNSSYEIPVERMMRALAIEDAAGQAELVKSLEYAQSLVKSL